jgi:sugar lactone lactonase YvrE
LLAATRHICLLPSLTLALAACAQESRLFKPASSASYSGYFAVSSTGFNTVTLFDESGTFVRLLRDLNYPSESPYGLGISLSGNLLAVIEGVDRVESISLADGSYSNFVLNASLTANTVLGLAVDSAGSIYVAEQSTNTIEKFSPAGFRVGSPFIGTTVGSCVLSAPRQLAILGNGNLAVANTGNDRLNIYDTSGGCVAAVTAAPFGSNDPYGVAWDAAYSRIIVAFNGSSEIVRVDQDGSNPTQIYLDTAVISAPTSVACDGAGGLYVGNTGLDTVEKLAFDGSTATRAGTSPFIPTSAYMRDPSGIVRIP